MTDTADTTDAGPVTKRDLIDEKIDKVWPDGPVEHEPVETSLAMVTTRPKFSVLAEELDAAKMMAMAGPFIPEFMRGNPGQCLAVLQLSKRWSKYDARTNSWVSFDPIAIASCTYLVVSADGKQSVGYTSQFIGAIVDAFVPLARRMRYRYDGEGQQRTCTAYATRPGDEEPFEYTTPPLSLITPKKSPLWQSDPDRQLAYYARRAWARLFTPGVLLGVYDIDELEGVADTRAHRVRDLSHVEGLHDRLRRARDAGNSQRAEGFRADAVDAGMAAEPTPEPTPTRRPARKRPARAKERVSRPRRSSTAATPEKRVMGRRTVAQPAPAEPSPAETDVGAEPADTMPPLPQTAEEYAAHVVAWLMTLNTEEAIEARWSREMKLRRACNVTEQMRTAIRTQVDQRIQQLRQA